MRILNTHTGNAELYFDASNGDLAGSDYALIRQTNSDLSLLLQTYSSGGNIILRSKDTTSLTLDGLNAEFGGNVRGSSTTTGSYASLVV